MWLNDEVIFAMLIHKATIHRCLTMHPYACQILFPGRKSFWWGFEGYVLRCYTWGQCENGNNCMPKWGITWKKLSFKGAEGKVI